MCFVASWLVRPQDKTTVEEADQSLPGVRRLYIPRSTNPDVEREAPAIAGAQYIVADDWPYIFDGLLADAVWASGAGGSRRSTAEHGEGRPGASRAYAESNSNRNKCAFFLWAHSPLLRPTRLVKEKEAVDWSELWYYVFREIQRRGEFDSVILLAPDAHNRYHGGQRRLRSYAAWLARKTRLVLSTLLDNGASRASSRPKGTAEAKEGAHMWDDDLVTGRTHPRMHMHQRRLAARAPSKGPRAPRLEFSVTPEKELSTTSWQGRGKLHSGAVSESRQEEKRNAAWKEEGEKTGEEESMPQAAAPTATESQWLAPLARGSGPKCDSIDMFLLGKGLGGLALRLMAAPNEDIWTPDPSSAEEQEILQLHALLHHLLLPPSTGSPPTPTPTPTVRLRSVVTVQSLNAGLGARAEKKRNMFVEFLLRRLRGFARWLPVDSLNLMLGASFLKVVVHGDKDRLLCTLAQQEKQTYSYQHRMGSLLSLADSVIYYGHLGDKKWLPPASLLGIWDPVLLDSVGVDVVYHNHRHHNHYRFIDVARSPSNAKQAQDGNDRMRGPSKPDDSRVGAGLGASSRAAVPGAPAKRTRYSAVVPGALGATLEASKRLRGPGGSRSREGFPDTFDERGRRGSLFQSLYTDDIEARPTVPQFEKSLLLFDRSVCKVLPPDKLYETTLQLLELINEHQQPAPFVPLRFGRSTEYKTLYVDGENMQRLGFFYFGKKRTNFAVNKFGLLHAAVRSFQTRAVIEATEFDNDKSIPAEAWFIPAEHRKAKGPWTS
ncbi:hypothetical protein BESB_065090 [Besnoitia besnoiti]|uniref:Uncharacterized protein n=1 Tax=Besnoitia besnoiti TaxID=94643 RepID=A0A2A9M7M0_BESBE|nr:hypothetical protein BESB_065090 [Besnoitia besnoiti]PFH34478.1 hypothetical protein BESB_065090 [Besnoitia besnoiti]